MKQNCLSLAPEYFYALFSETILATPNINSSKIPISEGVDHAIRGSKSWKRNVKTGTKQMVIITKKGSQ
ncbi:hypothetical protein [Sporosarcina ureilytica]|uniref:hypothetical protein n=1 Tax=Sporosarcina ureilytica TaxID=298596 RepID=UPI00143C6451|nr:hypothetical protein [Sporosarcina ureilytica]